MATVDLRSLYSARAMRRRSSRPAMANWSSFSGNWKVMVLLLEVDHFRCRPTAQPPREARPIARRLLSQMVDRLGEVTQGGVPWQPLTGPTRLGTLGPYEGPR